MKLWGSEWFGCKKRIYIKRIRLVIMSWKFIIQTNSVCYERNRMKTRCRRGSEGASQVVLTKWASDKWILCYLSRPSSSSFICLMKMNKSFLNQLFFPHRRRKSCLTKYRVLLKHFNPGANHIVLICRLSDTYFSFITDLLATNRTPSARSAGELTAPRHVLIYNSRPEKREAS